MYIRAQETVFMRGEVNILYEFIVFSGGEKAVITGCATGIGKGLAAGLARAGADIIALDIGDLEDTGKMVENLGRQCRCYHVDLSDSADVDEVWARLLEEAGQVDILCNNAGMQFRRNAFEYPEEMFDKVIAVNLKAPYRLSQKAAVHFRDKGIKGKSSIPPPFLPPSEGLRSAVIPVPNTASWV